MPSLRSRQVVFPDDVRPATVVFEGGRIIAVTDDPADLDVGDLVVLPGLVDTHVHVNEPGRTDWEGFATATEAAAAGGTTTLVDMPLNSLPPTVGVAELNAKREATRGKLAVDVAFWGGLIPGSGDQIEAMAAAGVCGFKAFMCDSGVAEFPPLDSKEMEELLPTLGRLGLPLLVHAEDPGLLVAPAGDPRSYRTYLDSRPPGAEAAAVETLARLAAGSAAPIHVVHVAAAEAVDVLRRARSEGVPITGETCPHYLTFDASTIGEGDTLFKSAPPIRHDEHRRALWNGLDDGALSMVVSDHSPAPPDLKSSGDFLSAWGGIASLQLRLAATWTGARHRAAGLVRLAAWLAEAPARLAGLDNRKGRIGVGMDADLVVFDPHAEGRVEEASLRHRHRATPYAGLDLAGRVAMTILGGETVFDGDSVTHGRGQMLRRGACD